MTTLLDRTLMTVPQTPPLTTRGPDRLQATFGVDLGAGSFVVFPQGTQTSLLPVSGDLSFVGVPSLDATLARAAYSLTASAVTGHAGLHTEIGHRRDRNDRRQRSHHPRRLLHGPHAHRAGGRPRGAGLT